MAGVATRTADRAPRSIPDQPGTYSMADDRLAACYLLSMTLGHAKLKSPLQGKRSLKSLWDCHNAIGQFEGYSRPESDLLTNEFRQIIKDSGVVGYAAAIDKIAWDELVTAERRQNMGPADNFCLTRCVRNALASAKDQFKEDEIAIVYDLGRKPHLPSRIETFDWSRGIESPRVTSFTSGKVADVVPLQGADMIATESYWFAQRYGSADGTEPRPHFIKSAQGNGVFMGRSASRRSTVTVYVWPLLSVESSLAVNFRGRH
jgi:hypothetical protein